MRGTSHVVAACALVLACACGTGDTRIDPGDLELRDLLGISPEAAGAWDEEQKASAREVLLDALDDDASGLVDVELATADTVDGQIARSLATLDARRFAEGNDALGFVRVSIAGTALTGQRIRAGAQDITARDKLLAALAQGAGAKAEDEVVTVPSPRLSVVASYVASTPPRLLVNPVLLTVLDGEPLALPDETAPVAYPPNRRGEREREREMSTLAAGNPYSFYGSVAECAYAQRSRCTACVASANCVPVTDATDGAAECQALDANGGRGYFLLCINLSLAISSVDDCTADLRPSCPRDTDAASDLGQLEENAVFLDDGSCGTGLDACLAKIYGAPKNPFPGLIDGGVDPVDPPRDINVSCGDSCSSDNDTNSNCEASPSCNCEGPSCGNSLSCDSSCSSSNNQSGCGDNCDSCSSDSDSDGDSGGGCGGGDGGSSGDSGGSCGSCSGDSGGSSGGCGGGSCGGDSGGGCGGGSCGGGSGGGGCSGGGGGGSCQTTKRAPNAVFAMVLSVSWALLPVPLAAFLRRRNRRRAKKQNEEVAS